MDLPSAAVLDPEEAEKMCEQYEGIRTPSDEDLAIIAALRAAADGKPVLNLRDAIKAGGRDENGYPRLAAMRADKNWCWLARDSKATSIQFHWNRSPRNSPAYNFHELFPAMEVSLSWSTWRVRSAVPVIPPQFRPPKYKLPNHVVLWEVEEWASIPAPSGDPALLRDLGHGLWAVEAVWDLTDLERLVLAGRSSS